MSIEVTYTPIEQQARTELIRYASCVVGRYITGGFEDATVADRAVLDALVAADAAMLAAGERQ